MTIKDSSFMQYGFGAQVAHKHDRKIQSKWKLQFSKMSNFTILDSKALPGEGPKISDNFEAMTKIKDIFLNRMNRAHGICQQTLKLPDRKMRSEPYLRRETFLLSHPLCSYSVLLCSYSVFTHFILLLCTYFFTFL